MLAAMAGGASASTHVARRAMTGPKRARVMACSDKRATRNIPLPTTNATQNGLSPSEIAAHITMGSIGKKATLVNTWPTWPTSNAYPRCAMSRYQVVSQLPSTENDSGTEGSSATSGRPNTTDTMTASTVMNTRLASHATRGTPSHPHHGSARSRVVMPPKAPVGAGGGGAGWPSISASG